MRQTFSKDERLCSHIIIRRLFAGGLTFNLRPFRVTWLLQPLDLPSPVQVLISVPKYNFRKAVHRNLIRRRIKEAYRMNKHLIYNSLSSKGRQMAICITYTAKEIEPSDLIQGKIILLLQRLIIENEKVTG
ncbi:MAG: ribonuclease P protein component [Bacteroidota bacterium]